MLFFSCVSFCRLSFWLVVAAIMDPPTTDFPEVKTWADRITELIRLFGYGIAGGALALGFIMLMLSWGNERREATAKSGLVCAAIGVAGLLATTVIQAVIGRVVGGDLPK